LTNDFNRKEFEKRIEAQRREVLLLKDIVERQHHIIDYLENRLYCVLIDSDFTE